MRSKDKCRIAGCNEKAVGEILLNVFNGEPWYVAVCEKHLQGRIDISPDGKPIHDGFPQWKLKDSK